MSNPHTWLLNKIGSFAKVIKKQILEMWALWFLMLFPYFQNLKIFSKNPLGSSKFFKLHFNKQIVLPFIQKILRYYMRSKSKTKFLKTPQTPNTNPIELETLAPSVLVRGQISTILQRKLKSHPNHWERPYIKTIHT